MLTALSWFMAIYGTVLESVAYLNEYEHHFKTFCQKVFGSQV